MRGGFVASRMATDDVHDYSIGTSEGVCWIKFEADNFPGLCYFSGEFSLDRLLKILLRQVTSFV